MSEANQTLEVQPRINLVRVLNPLNPREHERGELEWGENKTVADYLPELKEAPKEAFVVSVNGGVVEAEDYALTYLTAGSSLVVCPVPQGGGGGKNIFRVVALIAVAVFAPYAAGWVNGALNLGLAAGSAGMAALTAGVALAGSMLVNALLPPPKPKAGIGSGDIEDSPSYGIDGAKNTAVEGIPVPVVYGRYRIGGNVVGAYVRNYGNTQWVHLLICAGEGPIAGLGDIKINDQPLFYGGTPRFDHDLRVYDGTPTQGPPAWFNSTVTPINVARKLDRSWTYHQTQQEVDRIRVDVVFPEGLFSVDKENGNIRGATVDMEFQARRLGTSTWHNIGSQVVIGYRETFYLYGYYQEDYFENRTWVPPRELDSLPWDYYRMGDYIYARSYETPGATENGERMGYVKKYPIYDARARARAASRSPVRRSFSSGTLPEGIYEVRMRRITAESSSQYLFNKVNVTDVNEIINERVGYRNTALLAIRLKLTDQLTGMPKVTYEHLGKLIRTWDSRNERWLWKPSSNPAWVALDMMTNDRYGGGLPMARVDIEAWKDWAEYCDQNGLEFNGVFEQAGNLWDAMQPVFRVGHAQPIMVGTRYSVAIERADSPVMLFNVGNIVSGTFATDWLPVADRANAIELTYYDEENDYKPTPLKIADHEAQKGAQRVAKVNMVGVTKRAQAAKEAKFHLNLNRYILQTCSFEAPIEAIACTIGDLIYVQHDMTQWGYGGRLEAGSTATTLKLDRPVATLSGRSYRALVAFDFVERATGTISAIYGNSLELSGWDGQDRVRRIQVAGKDIEVLDTFATGTAHGVVVANTDLAGVSVGDSYQLFDTDVIEERDVLYEAGERTEITLVSPLPAAPPQFAKWTFGETKKTNKPFRVKSISGGSELTRKIDAIEYNESVYDLGMDAVPTPNYSDLDSTVDHVANLDVTEELVRIGEGIRTRVWVSFQGVGDNYREGEVFVDFNDTGEYTSVGSGPERVSFEADDGDVLSIKIIAKDFLGAAADFNTAPTTSHTVIGKTAPPGDVVNLKASPTTDGYMLSWDAVSDLDLSGYEIREGGSYDTSELLVTGLSGTTYYVPISTPRKYSFFVRAIDTSGNYSENPSSVEVEIVPPPEVTGFDGRQNGERIDFYWDAIDLKGVRYRIRAGETWELGVPVVESATHNVSVVWPHTGIRRFWIKAVDWLGNESTLATFVTLNVAPMPGRNVVIETRQADLGWPGVKRNLTIIDGALQLDSGFATGDYIFESNLFQKFNARNLIDMDLVAVQESNLDWGGATFNWTSDEADATEWTEYGDVSNVTVNHYISTKLDVMPSDVIEVYSLNGDALGDNGGTPTNEIDVTYQNARFALGAYVADNTKLDWGATLGPTFSKTLWFRVDNADDHIVLASLKGTGIGLMVGYDPDGTFYLEDHLGERLELSYGDYRMRTGDQMFIGFAQTATERRLFVGKAESAAGYASQEAAPLGTFTSVRLYGNI